MMTEKIALKGLTKRFGPLLAVDDISMSIASGEVLGFLGPNGAGKSTLLKIMAGQDPEFTGEAWAADGVRVGYLEQEPELDPSKDVEGNVMEGLGETKALLDKFNEISERFTEPMDDDEMNALLAEQGELQEKIDAADGWELERTIEIAMDALRCPPGDADVESWPASQGSQIRAVRKNTSDLIRPPQSPELAGHERDDVSSRVPGRVQIGAEVCRQPKRFGAYHRDQVPLDRRRGWPFRGRLW